MKVSELSTPALVVDVDLFDANVATAESLFGAANKLIRPHFKAHRMVELIKRQLGAHAIGATCATIGEAEALVAAGVENVLIANAVVSSRKLERLAALARTARLTLAVDSPDSVARVAAAADSNNAELSLLIDVDVGLNRGGVKSVGAAVDLARAIHATRGLHLAGVMGYEGRQRAVAPERTARIQHAYRTLGRVKAALESAGFECLSVSAAGTSTIREALADPTITEIQAGMYALMDSDLDGLRLPFRHAARVIASVISRTDGRVVLDAGRMTVGSDTGVPRTGLAAAKVVAVSDEHLTMQCTELTPEIGALVDLYPAHMGMTCLLHGRAWLVRVDEVIGTIDALPRAKAR